MQLLKTTFILFIVFGSLNSYCFPVAAEEKIHINQVGYHPTSRKIAIVTHSANTNFKIIEFGSNREVFAGSLSSPKYWDMADETVKVADFSALKTPGKYFVRVDKMTTSFQFEIKDNIFQATLVDALKAFYYNRASVALDASYAGIYERPAGHPDTVIAMHPQATDTHRPQGSILSSPKGWYDAGDYNKYIVNSGITMFTLLKALEHYPETFRKLNTSIPESHNDIPDILDEIMWNLDWMETMQDPNDGGVYHKLTTLRFTRPGMPHLQYQPRYMVQKSTAATLDFAAVMALSARILRKYEAVYPGLPARYTSAAEKAWKWAKKNPHILYEQPEDVRTGKYAHPDETLTDEWLWAASELFILTSQSRYQKHIHVPTHPHVPEWGHVGMLGLLSLMDHKKCPKKLRHRIRATIVKMATQLVQEQKQSAYLVPMTRNNFIWGSNSVALNKAIILLAAYRIDSQPSFSFGALSLVDYVLGRNPTGYCFVTGQGSKSPKHIHHRVSKADGIPEPVPGFLVGGPQPGWQDSCKYPTKIPAKTYMDHWCSYSTNEVAINWNAPLVYVLSAFHSIHSK